MTKCDRTWRTRIGQHVDCHVSLSNCKLIYCAYQLKNRTTHGRSPVFAKLWIDLLCMSAEEQERDNTWTVACLCLTVNWFTMHVSWRTGQHVDYYLSLPNHELVYCACQLKNGTTHGLSPVFACELVYCAVLQLKNKNGTTNGPSPVFAKLWIDLLCMSAEEQEQDNMWTVACLCPTVN